MLPRGCFPIHQWGGAFLSRGFVTPVVTRPLDSCPRLVGQGDTETRRAWELSCQSVTGDWTEKRERFSKFQQRGRCTEVDLICPLWLDFVCSTILQLQMRQTRSADWEWIIRIKGLNPPPKNLENWTEFPKHAIKGTKQPYNPLKWLTCKIIIFSQIGFVSTLFFWSI